jgi:hypothetical protein
MDDSKITSHGQSDESVKSLDEPSTDKTQNGESHLPERLKVDNEAEEDDAISIQTATDVLLPIEPDSEPPQEHKIGLDINKIRGWSGSEYDDYEYE